MEIVPAIIPNDFDEIRTKIKLVEPHVQWVQIDISDGRFTTVRTWDNPAELKSLQTSLKIEVHLMISEPEKEIGRWVGSGAKRILVHYESTENLAPVLDQIQAAGIEAGIVLNLQTPVGVLDSIDFSKYKNISVIQLMGISEIGYSGHPFSERVLPKIFDLRTKFQEMKIAVDGGINKETARKAADSGADILTSGSAIFSAQDAGKAIIEIKESLK